MRPVEEKMPDLRRVLQLVELELVKAWTKHPGEFHNAHEGFAVLKEEVDELWDEVKRDTAYTKAGMKEAIQTAAMAVRFIVELHAHPKGDPAARLELGYEGYRT